MIGLNQALECLGKMPVTKCILSFVFDLPIEYCRHWLVGFRHALRPSTCCWRAATISQAYWKDGGQHNFALGTNLA
ncbi:hypothetical protein D3C85_1138430 [compost metagenome]